MKIIDSSVWIDYFNGITSRETDILNELLGSEPVGIGDLILTEVLQGFSSERDFFTAKAALLSLPCYSMVGNDIAVKSAENYRVLRQKGITVRKTIDMLIGTFCIENGLPLLHNDKDFAPLKVHLGLKTV